MNSKEFLEIAKKKYEEVQITEIIIQEDNIEYLNEERKKYETSFDKLYEIKVRCGKKTVKLKTNYLDEELFSKLDLKIKYIETENEDFYLKDTKNNNETRSLNEPNVKKFLKEIEKCLQLKNKYKEIQKIELGYVETCRMMHILNSNGVDFNTNSHTYTFYLEVLAQELEKSAVARRTVKAVHSLNVEKLTEDAIKEAIIRLKEKELITGKYKVLFQNEMAASLISKIMKGLNAEEVQKKTTLFHDQLEKKVGSELLTIIEDPTNENYPGYTLFDDEGTKTYKKVVIQNGILKTFFYNNKTALKENRKSTGNGYQTITTSNLYVEKGKKSFDALIAEMKNGIVVTSFAGAMDAIKLETGNISIQIFGYYVENGKIISGIKPAVLTTTFEEVLNKVVAVGDDLTFATTAVGSPSLLFDSLNIAG